jgi:hypothetical protein
MPGDGGGNGGMKGRRRGENVVGEDVALGRGQDRIDSRNRRPEPGEHLLQRCRGLLHSFQPVRIGRSAGCLALRA